MADDTFDIAVIGGGPAGLAAGMWAARYRRRVLLLDAGEQRNRWADATHGYLGLDGLSPRDLIDCALREVGSYPEIQLRKHGTCALRRRRADGQMKIVDERCC